MPEEGWYGNALQVASEAGYKKVEEMLLSHGADVNAKGEGTVMRYK